MARLPAITLELPFPPSVNNFHTVANGRKTTGGRGRDWFDEASFWLLRQGPFREIDPLARLRVTVDVYEPDRRKRDIDNLSKPALDALVKSGVIEDDCLVDDFRIRRRGRAKPAYLRVVVREVAS